MYYKDVLCYFVSISINDKMYGKTQWLTEDVSATTRHLHFYQKSAFHGILFMEEISIFWYVNQKNLLISSKDIGKWFFPAIGDKWDANFLSLVLKNW